VIVSTESVFVFQDGKEINVICKNVRMTVIIMVNALIGNVNATKAGKVMIAISKTVKANVKTKENVLKEYVTVLQGLVEITANLKVMIKHVRKKNALRPVVKINFVILVSVIVSVFLLISDLNANIKNVQLSVPMAHVII